MLPTQHPDRTPVAHRAAACISRRAQDDPRSGRRWPRQGKNLQRQCDPDERREANHLVVVANDRRCCKPGIRAEPGHHAQCEVADTSQDAAWKYDRRDRKRHQGAEGVRFEPEQQKHAHKGCQSKDADGGVIIHPPRLLCQHGIATPRIRKQKARADETSVAFSTLKV